jgi:hypothetical protein
MLLWKLAHLLLNQQKVWPTDIADQELKGILLAAQN